MARESLALFVTLNLTFLCLIVSALPFSLLPGLAVLPGVAPDYKPVEPTPVPKPITEPTPNYNNYETNPTPYLTTSPSPPPPPPSPPPPLPPSPSPPPPPPPAKPICPIKPPTECVNPEFSKCCMKLRNVSSVSNNDPEIMSACLCDITKEVFAKPDHAMDVDRFNGLADQIFHGLSSQCKVLTDEMATQESTKCKLEKDSPPSHQE